MFAVNWEKSILKILIFTITLMEMFNLKNIIILKIYLKMKSAVKAYVPNKQKMCCIFNMIMFTHVLLSSLRLNFHHQFGTFKFILLCILLVA